LKSTNTTTTKTRDQPVDDINIETSKIAAMAKEQQIDMDEIDTVLKTHQGFIASQKGTLDKFQKRLDDMQTQINIVLDLVEEVSDLSLDN